MKFPRLLIPLFVIAGILVAAVFSWAISNLASTTRSFSIDGRRFTFVPSEECDVSLIERELVNNGMDLPSESLKSLPFHPDISFALAQEGEDSASEQFPIPASFDIEHTLHLANHEGAVAIAFGAFHRPLRESLVFLQSQGWSVPASFDSDRHGMVATYSHGKERFLAFLEAKGSGFLILRHLDR